MIGAVLVESHKTDMGQLCRAAGKAKEALGQEIVAVIADKGYESGPNIEKCILSGVIPDVGFKYDWEERVFNLDYIPGEITEEQRASEKLEDIQACLHAGVLPRCYENTNLSVELQHEGVESCFIRHEDDTVTCPMGRQ